MGGDRPFELLDGPTRILPKSGPEAPRRVYARAVHKNAVQRLASSTQADDCDAGLSVSDSDEPGDEQAEIWGHCQAWQRFRLGELDREICRFAQHPRKITLT